GVFFPNAGRMPCERGSVSSDPSGFTHAAATTPHDVPPSEARRQSPSARAASNASTPSIASSESHRSGSSSILPLQSSSTPLPGTSKAPGFTAQSLSLQSPPLAVNPSPSASSGAGVQNPSSNANVFAP